MRTNVLSFVMREKPALEGDLALCAPVIAREARAQGKSLAAHYAHLVVHGVLHLQGHDHETPRAARRMERRESRIVTALGFPDPYKETGMNVKRGRMTSFSGRRSAGSSFILHPSSFCLS
jgi:probable rRNA maturation factor